MRARKKSCCRPMLLRKPRPVSFRTVVGEAETLRQGVPRVGGPAEPVPAHLVAVEAPGPQVAAGRAGVGRGEQPVVVPLDRLLHRLDEPLALACGPRPRPAACSGAACRPGRPGTRRRREVEVLDLAHEGDDVTRLAWQPKQFQSPTSALTENDGVFSAWNGHSPVNRRPDCLSCMC